MTRVGECSNDVLSTPVKQDQLDLDASVTISEPMTPDNNLEEMMLNLDETNSYSPTKNAEALAMAPLMVPYYLQNVTKAMDEVMISPIDHTYFNDNDEMIICIFALCTGKA